MKRTHLCRFCFKSRVLHDGIICEPCRRLGPPAIARRERTRVKRLRERAALLLQGVEIIEQFAGRLETIDRRSWRRGSAKSFPRENYPA